MNGVNKVILIGNLGGDPEIRVLETGVKMARFNIATSEDYVDKSGTWQRFTQWHSIVCWRSIADYAEFNVRVGSLVRIEGRLRSRKFAYTGNDEKQSPYEIIATSLQALTNDATCDKPQENQSLKLSQSIAKAPLDADDLPF